MRFDRDHSGAWIIDPAALADRLGITTSHFLSQARRGLVTSRAIAGSGDDIGRSLITVRAGEAGWQGIFDRDGALISERRLPIGA